MGPVGIIYFLHAPQARTIKIWFTTMLSDRLAKLRNGSPEHLELLKTIKGSVAIEQTLFIMWSKHRLHGEWFRATPDLLAYITDLEAEYEYTPVLQKLVAQGGNTD